MLIYDILIFECRWWVFVGTLTGKGDEQIVAGRTVAWWRCREQMLRQEKNELQQR